MRPAFVVVLLLMGLAPPTVSAQPQPADFKIIIHPDNPITSIDAGFLRDAYLKKTLTWSKGKTIRPVDLPATTAVRQRFVARILKRTPSQLRYYWNRRVFSGKGVPPVQVDSVAAAVAYVVGHPGAVAYVPPDADTGDAKVILLR